ncbi:MAG: Rab family GTPase [Thermoplasmata archaeon]
MSNVLVKKKVNLLGDQGVGKTSLVLRYVKNVFGEEYLKTIGTNIYTKDVSFQEGNVKLIIQDIMGESGFRSVQRGAFRGSTGAIAVVDITRQDTLDYLVEDWIPVYKKNSSEDNPILLAVNKFDLDDKNISHRDLDEVYEHFDHVLFTSAKTGRNVEYMFKYIASKVVDNLQFSSKDIEDIVLEREVDSPKDLLDTLLAISSDIGTIPYKIRDGLFEESGIDKFDLDEEIFAIKEENVLKFAKLLMYIYDERKDDHPRDLVKKMLERYRS